MASKAMSFAEVVELADRLSLEEKEALLELLRKRTLEQRRAQLAQDIKAAREECKRGRCKPITPFELELQGRA